MRNRLDSRYLWCPARQPGHASPAVLIAGCLLALLFASGCKSNKAARLGGGPGDAQAGDGSSVNGPDGSTIDSGPSCGLITCESAHATCGPVGDGCGGVIQCGTCNFPETCGGGGVPSQCGGNGGCKPLTCDELDLHCGPAGDGCGGTLDCGACTNPGDTCGGGGTAGVCGQTTSGDGPMTCKPRTCADDNAACGVIGDGCGGTLDCGSCTSPETCGGGGTAFHCGRSPACKPWTCAQLNATCGTIGDGCGGTLDCGATCPVAGDSCGGGGVPFRCGHPSGADAGPVSTCVPQTCAEVGANCGPVADGCGNLLNCGTCHGLETCGGGGSPSVCGHTGGTCTPLTACPANRCGQMGDGCGGTLECGPCNAPDTCGGGGTPSVCGHRTVPDAGPACVPRTSCPAHACGPVTDGCGGVIQCGGCTAPQTCGGGGTPSVCGTSAQHCTARTCAQLGVNCGPVGDGCGGLLQCGGCMAPETCGGGGHASVCGTNGDAGPGCTGLCLQQVTCDGGQTTVSGTVVAPTPTQFGSPDPLYNALVYIPNGPVQPFTPGVSCDRCGTPVSGAPLVSAVTGPDGTFTLLNAPVGSNIPLVIQLGRWRRQVTIPTVTACQNTALPASLTRLPRNHTEGDIPLMAMATGNVDTLECVLRKIGIDESEFTDPSGNGRVQFYYANGAYPHTGIQPPNFSALYSSTTTLSRYDLVLFACEGFQNDNIPMSGKSNVITYANAGGRVFATHYSYVWLYDIMPWNMTAAWNVDTNGSHHPPDPLIANIDQMTARGQAFAQWVANVGAASGPGQITIHVSRHDLDSVVSPATRYIYSTNPVTVQHYAFNTPWNTPAAQQCGRTVFSDFHVADVQTSNGRAFPSECSNGPLTPQEKVLEFMLFDLASCIQPDQPSPPSCTPQTCHSLGIGCGPAGDGCGGTLQCGSCTAPQTCGGGGTPYQCGGTGCTRQTCASQNIQCGLAGDGCGGMLSCGSCTAPDTCGGGGVSGVCGHRSVDAGPVCTPITTCPENACGPIADGCGGLLQCGACAAPNTCGGGGVPSRCGHSGCTPQTCQQQGIRCGPAGDGCGGTIASCGTCTSPDTCGGGGVPGICGHRAGDGGGGCTPKTCAEQGLNCGFSTDGCGNLLNCGTCTAPQTCGGAGMPGVCGTPACTPLTCDQQSLACGTTGDGCGDTINCGVCPAGTVCGGGGSGRCGVGTCVPKTCADENLSCGQAGDGCGNVLNCGTCPSGQTCGGGGQPGVCGSGACQPRTCQAASATCGIIADGCGGTVNCGTCLAPTTCGGGGIPNQCGTGF